MPRRSWGSKPPAGADGSTPESAAWSAVDDAVRAGLVPSALVEHVRSTGEFSLIHLLEYTGQRALDVGDDAAAEHLYLVAVRLGTTNAGVLYNLGNIAARDGRDPDAIRQYDAAIALDPDLALAHYNRGLRYRALGDERRAREDIAAAIARGYDGLHAYAALLRGRLELGSPVDALEQAVAVQQLLAAGDADIALMMARLECHQRRVGTNAPVRDRVAFVVALESEWALTIRLGDAAGALERGEELIRSCRDLAAIDPASWAVADRPLRAFVADRLPSRLRRMVDVYEAAGRHDAALAAGAAAVQLAGGPSAPNRDVGDAARSVADSVYAEMRRRAQQT